MIKTENFHVKKLKIKYSIPSNTFNKIKWCIHLYILKEENMFLVKFENASNNRKYTFQ